jgi:hypothetical protein
MFTERDRLVLQLGFSSRAHCCDGMCARDRRHYSWCDGNGRGGCALPRHPAARGAVELLQLSQTESEGEDAKYPLSAARRGRIQSERRRFSGSRERSGAGQDTGECTVSCTR